MNALAGQDFAIVQAPEAQWLVLQCGPARTLALAAALKDRGAWTPTWKRRRRMPRSNVFRPTVEPCIPGLVFIPEATGFELPVVPRIRFRHMRAPDFTLTRVPDRQLEPLRRIADKPLVPASRLPKPGQRVRFGEGPFQGLMAKVIRCTQRYATVAVDGFAQPLQVPPCILQERAA